MSDAWDGYQPRDCGEHRTTGGRAWCFDCQEWCYLEGPCRGCEIEPLREVAQAAKALEIDRVSAYICGMSLPLVLEPERDRVLRHINTLEAQLKNLRGPL